MFLNTEWLRLNSYEKHNDQWQTHIRNSEFFFHDNGQNDPKAELSAFIAAAQSTDENASSNNRICDYPARLAFLNQNGIDTGSLSDICAASEFGKIISATQSVSLIFADGYFGNPASYYGHVLLKLNSIKNPKTNDTGLLDTAINYGAKIPPNENAVAYITKGVFGFYKGSFQSNDFFLNTVQYADQQSRDFWAYDLTLSTAQARHMARRAIEWKNAKFDYYFFGDNCAHRVRDLLSEVTGTPIAKDNGLWLMPMQVIEGVARQQNNDEHRLIENIRYIPSGRTKLFAILDKLSETEMHALTQLLDGNNAPLNELTEQQNKTILAAADLHLRKVISDAEAKSRPDANIANLKKKRQEVLLSLFRLQSVDARLAQPQKPNAPHSGGRNGSAITLGTIDDERLGSGQYLAIRPAYTDKLATDIGKIADSTLHMGKAEFTHFDQNLRLQKLTFIEVENLRAAKFDNRFEPGRVWYLAAGLTRHQNRPENDLKGFLTVGIGNNHLFTDKWNGYAMVQLHATENVAGFDRLYVGARFGLASQIGERTKLYIENTIKQKSNNQQYNESRAGIRHKLTPRFDITIDFQQASENDERLMVGLQRNF